MDAMSGNADGEDREPSDMDAEQSGRPEAAAQADMADASAKDLGASPSNTPPTSSQITLKGFPEYKTTFGIDWLEYGDVYEWPAAVFENVMAQLEAAKLHCQTTEQEEVRIRLNDTENVYVQRIGVKRGKVGGVHFEYRLVYHGISIALARRPGVAGGPANVFVALRGKDCLLHGALEAHASVNALLSRLGARSLSEEKMSRVDLRLDVTGLDSAVFKPLIDDRCFISRVQYIQAWENKVSSVWSGVTIGNHPRLLRIYDKILQQKRKYDAEVYRALIDRCWGGEEPASATRLEWELGRSYLKRYGIHSVADLRSMLGSLLSQLSTEWFRFTTERVVPGDKHQSRAETHPLWSAVQMALLEHAQVPAQKLVPIRYDLVQPKKLIAQAIGCFMSAALQRRIALLTYADFLRLVGEMVREHFRNDDLKIRFLERYWQRFKDKPGDYFNAA